MYAKNKRIISIIVVFFLFFSGICLENIQEDSSLTHIINNTGIAHTVSREIELTKSEAYTTEYLNIQNISYIRQLGNRNVSNGKAVRKGIEYLYMRKGLQNLSGFYTTAVVLRIREFFTKTAVIRYIHNQDGKKKIQMA